ncbi:MAG: energy-coupling factor transporter transmembrane component T [Verrucomicrobia bacterium]|nr:energy-coupling factor transporter transmembrane component T [Verrucomicrobiota bacterium]
MWLRQRAFIEKTLHRLTGTLEHAAYADDAGGKRGFLQQLDPRVKLLGFLGLIFAAAASHRLSVTAALFGAGLILALASGVFALLARFWGGVLFFTGAVVLPAVVLTPGHALLHLPWVGWAVTDHGLHSAVGLTARALATATFAALLVLTTRWGHLLKALRVLGVPTLLVVMLGMTYRALFVLLRLAHVFFEARRVRRVGRLGGSQRRQMAVSSAAMLLSKSVQHSGELYEAMVARGFRGEAHTLDEFRFTRWDWGMFALFGVGAAAAFAMGTLP